MSFCTTNENEKRWVLSSGFYEACTSGQLTAAKFLYNESIDVHAHDNILFRLCAKNGYLDVIKYLVSIKNQDTKINGFSLPTAMVSSRAFDAALMNDTVHLEVGEFLYQYGQEHDDPVDVRANSNLFAYVCRTGNFNAVKFLHKLDIENINPEAGHLNLCYGLAESVNCNNVEMTKYLCSLIDKGTLKSLLHVTKNEVSRYHPTTTQTLKWLYENEIYGTKNTFFAACCAGGNLENVKFLRELINSDSAEAEQDIILIEAIKCIFTKFVTTIKIEPEMSTYLFSLFENYVEQHPDVSLQQIVGQQTNIVGVENILLCQHRVVHLEFLCKHLDISDKIAHNVFVAYCGEGKLDCAIFMADHYNLNVRTQNDKAFRRVGNSLKSAWKAARDKLNLLNTARWLCNKCDQYQCSVEIHDMNGNPIEFSDNGAVKTEPIFKCVCAAKDWDSQYKKLLNNLNIPHCIELPRLHNTICYVCHDVDDANIVLPCQHMCCGLCFAEWYENTEHEKFCCYCTTKFEYENCAQISKDLLNTSEEPQ